MKLITSAATVDFLSKSAPRAWVKRAILWMIYADELKPYFTSGRVVAKAMVGSIISEIEGIDFNGPLDARDEKIRQHFNSDFSAKLVGRRIHDYVEDDPIEWDENEAPHAVGAGFFLYSDDIDWEEGTLNAQIFDPTLGDLHQHLLWDEDEHLYSGFDKPDYSVSLKGMCFHKDEVEMLQPGEEIDAARLSRVATGGAHIGRPRKWDWDGALTHLLGLAQHPDGLPTGPGAQAKIENLIADWFVASTGSSPTGSQIRGCAQRVMSALKTPEM